jgi:hypothetical protein
MVSGMQQLNAEIGILSAFSVQPHAGVFITQVGGGDSLIRGGFHKAIYALCWKFALCAHCFS